MRPLSVLLTNNALALRSGSETYLRDVALALLARGHRPVAFSLVLGDTAADLRRATVPVLDDLTRLAVPPDLIHGHHHLETLIAALTFPAAPIVNFCHGWLPWEERPLHHPSVRLYVAVDEVCVDRLVREEGVAPERVELLLNFVDLSRFAPRAPLPRRPARAAVVSHAATPDNYARTIVEAGRAAGLPVDLVGAAAGTATAAPEAVLRDYDLVFAKGRTALEALAVGCATVLTDAVGAGALVMPLDYDRMRQRNFGVRELTRGHEVSWYAAQIARYDAGAAADVSSRVRSEAGLDAAMTRLIEIYERARSLPVGHGDPQRAAAQHCSRIARELKAAHGVSVDLLRARAELSAARAESEQQEAGVRERLDELQALSLRLTAMTGVLTAEREQAAGRDRELEASQAAIAGLRQETDALRQEVAAFQALPSLRLRDALLRTPVLGPTVRRVARRLAGRGAEPTPRDHS